MLWCRAETTNNRMELMGVIEGLASLKRPCQVELVTDSQYVAKGISEWLPNWKRQGWQRKEKGQLKPVANVDLWQRVDSLLSIHKVRVTHVLGHRGHPENEACDRMAVDAYKQLMEDQKAERQAGFDDDCPRGTAAESACLQGYLPASRGCRAMSSISARSNGRDWKRNPLIWSYGSKNSVSSMLRIWSPALDE